MDFYKEHYKELYSNNKITKKERKRIASTISVIPDDCNSLLEVGCGDGRILNTIQTKFKKIYGVDINNQALKKVLVPNMEADASKLPFKDKSFDIILCCEVLEHIPYHQYKQSLRELERVAKKYILISVPNNENLEIKSVKCPICGCTFHPYRHLRNFKSDELITIFPKFKLKEQKTILQIKTFPDSTIKILKLMNIFKFPFPKNALCPQCGYITSITKKIEKNEIENKFNLKKVLTDPLKFKTKGG